MSTVDLTAKTLTLQWLTIARPKGLRQQCNIVVSPDPNFSLGTVVHGCPPSSFPYKALMPTLLAQWKEIRSIFLRFSCDLIVGTSEYDFYNADYGYAYNYSSRRGRACSCLPLLLDYFNRSDWVCIPDSGLKSSEGKTVREVLLNVIKAFPHYDLESAEEIKKVIKDIEAKFGEVASIKERTTRTPERVLMYLAATVVP